jgi:hypothetical protein
MLSSEDMPYNAKQLLNGLQVGFIFKPKDGDVLNTQ